MSTHEKRLKRTEREELERYRELDRLENQKVPYYCPCIKCVKCGVILTPIKASILEYKKTGKQTCSNCDCITEETRKQTLEEVLKELESEVKLCSFLNTYEATSVIDFIVRYKTRLEQKLKEMEK